MSTQVTHLFGKRDLRSLQNEAPTPLYHQLYTLLKSRILDGSISHGTQLPNEQELCDAFGVSRITAKRAMDELAKDELVVRRRGRGTHVIHHYEPEPVRAPLVGMLEKLADMGRHTRINVITVEKVVPPRDVAEELDLQRGDRAWHVLRVRSNDEGIPFAYYESWTIGIKRGFTKRELEKRTRLEVIRENGVLLHRIEQFLAAQEASQEVADALQMKVGQPVLTLDRHSYDGSGKLVDLLYCQYHPKRFHYRMELGPEQ